MKIINITNEIFYTYIQSHLKQSILYSIFSSKKREKKLASSINYETFSNPSRIVKEISTFDKAKDDF